MPVTERNVEYLTLQEAAERFGVSIPTLRSWRRQQLITRYERGDGLAVVDAAEVEQRIAKRYEIRRVDHNDQADD